MDEDKVTAFKVKLQANLESYEKEVMTGKKNKFQRDKSDFECKQAYKWKHAGNPRNISRGRGNYNIPNNRSDNMASSSIGINSNSSDVFLSETSDEGVLGEDYVMIVEIRKLQANKIRDKNLSKAELLAIRSLQNNAAFVIKEADKGDPTVTFMKKLDRLLTSACQFNIITKKEKGFLEVNSPKIPTFYMLPKPYVLGLQSHLRDSMQLVQHLQDMQFPPGTLILTCDVESLYSNISHSDGLQATQYFLHKSSCGDPAHHTFLGTVEQCTDFVSLLNTNSLNISLTHKISDITADFLDLRLTLDEQGFRRGYL
ncbi:uncharacterized protein LOC122935168 [Bufo gargarizans]|uniref:uncharacterized protein LOC122935168 n=1 Tax=Bufo gargarizans TaxID=30331 RepID=UPI001CF541B0|nr:uncharacterized protein LOC122935168 [Bufo gargarizans]